MASIDELSPISQLATSDLLPVWNTINGDTRKASLNLLREFILDVTAAAGTTTSIEDSDTVLIHDNSEGMTSQATAIVVRDYVVGGLFTPLSEETTLDGADSFCVYDDSASGTVKVSGSVVRDYVRDTLFSGLTAESTVSSDDRFIVYDTSNTAVRSFTTADIDTYLKSSAYTTERSSPSSTGFNVVLTDDSD
jgi:hypothetical protein